MLVVLSLFCCGCVGTNGESEQTGLVQGEEIEIDNVMPAEAIPISESPVSKSRLCLITEEFPPFIIWMRTVLKHLFINLE